MIIKERIEVRGQVDIKLSENAVVLSTGVVNDEPVMWIDEPDMDARVHTLHVRSLFTGDEAPLPRHPHRTESGALTGWWHKASLVNHGIVVHVFTCWEDA